MAKKKRMLTVRNRGKEKIDSTELSGLWRLILGISLVSLAVVCNLLLPRPSVSQMNGGASSAFRNQDIEDPLRPPVPEDILEITSDEGWLEGQLPVANTQVQISFMYQCPDCSSLWFEYQIDQDPVQKRLVDHYLLHDINWYHIKFDDKTIYQRTWTYDSFDTLINDIHSIHHRIAWESDLLQQLILPDNSEGVSLEDLDNLSQVDYIVTTYQGNSAAYDWHIYKTTISWPPSTLQKSLRWRLNSQNQQGDFTSIRLGKIQSHPL